MLITLEEARAQARLPANYPEAQLLPYIAAAGAAAAEFLQRAIYADAPALQDALRQLPQRMQDAADSYAAAVAAAQALPEGVQREVALQLAINAYQAAVNDYRNVRDGMVMTPDVKSAVLLLFEHLFENRSASSEKAMIEIPLGVNSLLWPHRLNLGV